MQDLNTYLLIIGMFTTTEDDYMLKLMREIKTKSYLDQEGIDMKSFFIKSISTFIKSICKHSLIEEVASNIFKTWI